MKCTWNVDPKSHTHIPKVCGKSAVVICQGPREFQIDPLCKEHYECVKEAQVRDEHVDNVWKSWKIFTPDEFKVRRVMSS